MAKSTTPKKKNSTALAGALAAFDETSTSSAAQSLIASEAVIEVVATETPPAEPTPIVETPEPIVPPAEPTPVVVTETSIKAKAASRKKAQPEPITPPEPAADSTGVKVNAVLYGQFETWQKTLTHSKNHALNQNLFVALIQIGVIPAPPQTLYFASPELRLAYLEQALREAVKQNFNQVMLTLDEILKRPAS